MDAGLVTVLVIGMICITILGVVIIAANAARDLKGTWVDEKPEEKEGI